MKKGIMTICLCLLFILIGVIGNPFVFLSTYELSFENLPESFNGLKIVQISDTHIQEVGSLERQVLKQIKKIKPDLILITGDLVDNANFLEREVLHFLSEVGSEAPTFYSFGNHEYVITAEFEAKVREIGVTILRNDKVCLSKGEQVIELLGIDDPNLLKNETIENILQSKFNPNVFTILMSHRPEYFDLYDRYDVELVFSGHAHGGQFRFPFLGGGIAPNQGLFPTYTEGVHQSESTHLVISRGIGNSIIPIRFYNRPELILTILRADS